MEDLTQEIDRFLSKEMNDSEYEAFTKRLETDEALRKEVDLQRKTFRLLEAAEWTKTKNQVAQINKKSTKVISIGMLSKIAAVLVIGLFTTYFFVHRAYSDQYLFDAYHEAYPDRFTSMGDNTGWISQAMKLYHEENYGDAQKVFNQINYEKKEQETIYFLYEAVCLNKIGEYQKAISVLNQAESVERLNIPIKWELILAYVGAGQDDQAKKELHSFLQMNDGYQQEKAERLQKDLNSFWR